MTYTIAVCTVKNSWWWTEELSEICRVSLQNKSEKLVHLFGFIIRNSVIWRSCDRASWQISYNETNRCTNLSDLFWREILHVSDSSSVHHQELFTVHTAMVYVIQVCWQLASRIRMELNQFHPDPACKLSTNLYDIYNCCVYSEKLLMMDRGTLRNM